MAKFICKLFPSVVHRDLNRFSFTTLSAWAGLVAFRCVEASYTLASRSICYFLRYSFRSEIEIQKLWTRLQNSENQFLSATPSLSIGFGASLFLTPYPYTPVCYQHVSSDLVCACYKTITLSDVVGRLKIG